MTAIEILEKAGGISGYVISIITLAVLVIKPVREWVVKKVITITHKEKIDELSKELCDLKEQMSEIMRMLFENEKDRLKGELFNCGNRCRRNIPLTLEEYRYIQDVYQKYNSQLHCNHNGTEEYEFIRDYFNSYDNQEKIKR